MCVLGGGGGGGITTSLGRRTTSQPPPTNHTSTNAFRHKHHTQLTRTMAENKPIGAERAKTINNQPNAPLSSWFDTEEVFGASRGKNEKANIGARIAGTLWHCDAIARDVGLWKDSVCLEASSRPLDNQIHLAFAVRLQEMYIQEMCRVLAAIESGRMETAETHLVNCGIIRPAVDATEQTLRSLVWKAVPELARGRAVRAAACWQDDDERQKAVRGIRDTNGLIRAFLVNALDLATVLVNDARV